MKLITPGRALVAVLVLAACAAPPTPPPEPPDHGAEAEAMVRGLIEQWSAAAAAKDAEGFLSVYANDAVLMFEDAPDLRGIEAIRGAVSGMMQDPAFSLSFAADEVIAARSGDLAYETGAYTLSMSGPDGKPTSESGRYVVVWRKQADGAWKVAVDAPISDPPDAPPAS